MYLKKGKEGSNVSSRRVAIAFNLEAVFFLHIVVSTLFYIEKHGTCNYKMFDLANLKDQFLC